MRKAIIAAIGGVALLAGCGSPDKGSIQVQPKWKGAPYHLAFGAQPAKANPAGITIPAVKFTANPDALETRAVLVVRFDATGAAGKGEIANRLIGAPVDIHGTDGALPADYVDKASKGLTDYLGNYCLQGKVNVSVALARSSLSPTAGEAEVEAKRISDWLPLDATYKGRHSKC